MLPVIQRQIPVIADEAIEMEFGTGAVKVTPAHDPAGSAAPEDREMHAALARFSSRVPSSRTSSSGRPAARITTRPSSSARTAAAGGGR